MSKNNFNQNITTSDTEIVKQIQEIYKKLGISRTGISKELQEILDLCQAYSQKTAEKNPYRTLLEIQKKAQEEMSTDLDAYEDAFEKRATIDKWYYNELKKLHQNNAGLSSTELSEARNSLDDLYNKRSIEAEEEVWMERGEKIAGIFQDSCSGIIDNYKNFGDEMKDLAKDLSLFLLQEASKTAMQQLFSTNKMQGLLASLTSISQGGGFKGSGAALIKGIGRAFGIFHSGGIVPVGANAEIPGTNEQFALLKGGERILSPSENTNYSSGGGTSPVVFNNFNIKAWDSKDVRKYLTENKDLLNQITFEGIKYNNSNLRNMVRGA